MSTFEIVFLDGEKRIVNAFNFSCAKVIAAYSRIRFDNAQSYTQLTVNDDRCHMIGAMYVPMPTADGADNAQTDLAL